jgi:hypothetical protein
VPAQQRDQGSLCADAYLGARRLPARVAHQPGDALAADTDAVRLPKLGVHTRRSVGLERLDEHAPDQFAQLLVGELPTRARARTPGVIAGAGHAEHAAEPGDRVLCLLRLDQPQGHGR